MPAFLTDIADVLRRRTQDLPRGPGLHSPGLHSSGLRGAARAWTVVLLSLAGCGSTGSTEEALPLPDDSPPAPEGDGALAFDGSSQYATVGSAGFPFGLAAQTIALWVKPRRAEGDETLVALRKDYQSGVQLGLQEGVPTAWRVYARRPYVGASDALAVGVWHHLAYVFDGATHRLYVDGEERGTGTLEPNNRTSTGGWLGSFDGQRWFFQGEMDRVRVWSEARTQAQIVDDFTGGDPSSDALVLELSFDETDGLRAYDRSGRRNHATLGDGFSTWAPQRIPSDLGLE